MKHTLKYIFSAVLMVIPVLAFAQDPAIYTSDPASGVQYTVKNGVATGKSVSDSMDENGYYTIKLETFATGLKTVINKAIPSDIVLVLDYSSSMLMNGSVTANPNNQWYNGTGNDGLPNVRDYLYSLKVAVGEFVNQLKENNATLGLADGQTGNRIAIVLYANEVYSNDPSRNVSGNGNFYARHVREFIPVAEMSVEDKTERHPLYTNAHQLTYASKSVMYDGIDILSPSSYRGVGNAGYNGIDPSWNLGDVNKGTATGDALEVARGLVETNVANHPYTERSTTVVLFTDGEPSRIGNSGFYQNEAQKAVRQAYLIKTANATEATGTPNTTDDADSHVKVFTVGLLSSPSNQMRTFLEYVSTDFSLNPPTENPNPSNPYNMPTSGYLTGTKYGPYSSIVSQGADLSGVFSSIAEASGGSTAEIPVETQLVDVVSNSFEVPDGFEWDDVVVYTRSAKLDGTGWENRQNLSTVQVDPGDNPPMTVAQPAAGKIGIALVDGKLTVVGFDFSKDDDEGTYNGNFVGWRTGTTNCYGKELVIEFKIEGDPDATGGNGTNTNAAGSGVLVPIKDPTTGDITGYSMVNQYEVPHVNLPINLVIKKTGLRHGESATIQIYRSPQKIVDNKVVYDTDTGKPMPAASRHDVNDKKWENFSKVILTNMGEDGAEVTKTLLSLDAKYVYMLAEDNWGWAYILDKRIWDTSEKETNPFTFTNTENPDAVKHGEAVSVNHFGANARAETAKSSKTKTFTSGTGTGNENGSGSGTGSGTGTGE